MRSLSEIMFIAAYDIMHSYARIEQRHQKLRRLYCVGRSVVILLMFALCLIALCACNPVFSLQTRSSVILGKTAEQVIKLLGKPDDDTPGELIGKPGTRVMTYEGFGGGITGQSCQIQFVNGIATNLAYWENGGSPVRDH